MRRIPDLRTRSAGILLHLISLPAPHGIGDLGPESFRFADFLAESGQGWWQMLPIVPIGADRSPYNSPSAFAGNPLLISLEFLARDGLLMKRDIRPVKSLERDRVNYPAVARYKEARLRRAFREFGAFRDREGKEKFDAYCRAEDGWLSDFALFRALKTRFGGKPWTKWRKNLRSRIPEALCKAEKEMREEIRYHKFVQYLFSLQWKEFRGYCHEKRIGLIGDVPIYMSLDSSDVWSHQDLFRLNPMGNPTVVAGVPPDYYSKTGQLWGNPLFRWDVLRQRKYSWWIKRIRSKRGKFDALRLDHFIGFQRYWEVSGRARTAKNGRWIPGPGADFFREMIPRIGWAEFIAEDLGMITPDVTALRKKFGFPGMRVLQFELGFQSDAASGDDFPVPRNCVLYTGTHDNDTIVGWLSGMGKTRRQRARMWMGDEGKSGRKGSIREGRGAHWEMIRFAFASRANLVIIPLQDVLGLGNEARMNRPGTGRKNWKWRFRKGQLKKRDSDRLLRLAEANRRLPR